MRNEEKNGLLMNMLNINNELSFIRLVENTDWGNYF